MFWINKQNKYFRNRAHKIIKSFLIASWNESMRSYVNCKFDDFKRNGEMEDLLLKEQKSRCCYCMRTLHYKNHTTLEHVLPLKATDVELIQYYLHFNKIFYKKVRFYLIDKNNNQVKIKVPRYPHFCAYENLVISCDGSIFDYESDSKENQDYSRLHYCCNNYRGQNQIVPMFFLRNIHKCIKYENDGKISVLSSLSNYLSIENSINDLNLNYSTLILIRKAWYKLVIYRL